MNSVSKTVKFDSTQFLSNDQRKIVKRNLGFPFIDINDYVTDKTGQIDSSNLIQTALDDAVQTGIKHVVFPSGCYLIKNTINVPAGVILVGQPKLPFKAAFNLDFVCFLIDTEQSINKDAFILSVGSGMKGFAFYWPKQLKTAANPIQYGWAINTKAEPSQADNITVEDIMFTNCYRGLNVDFGGQWNVKNIFGQTFDIGVRCDRVYDVARLENVHFWDFWTGGNEPAKAFVQKNGKAIAIGKVDGLQMKNIFAWGHKNVIHFTDFGNGPAWCQATNVMSDICEVPIQIDKANIIQISNFNGTIINPGSGNAMIETGTKIDGEVSVMGMNYYYSMHGINVKSENGVIKLSNITKRSRAVDNTDIRGYKVINQSTAKVFIDESDYNDVSGIVQIGSNVIWSADENVSDLFINFSTPHLLEGNDGRVTAIANGSRFNLQGGIGVLTQPLPSINKAGIYLFECELKLNNASNLDSGQFYLRLSDGAINDIILPSLAVDQFHINKTRLLVPVIFRNQNLQLQFVYGTNTGDCSIDVTNLKVYQMNDVKVNQSTLDWLHLKQPNSLHDPAPNYNTRNIINTSVSTVIEPDKTSVVNVIGLDPVTITINTAKARKNLIVWIRHYDYNQTSPITVAVTSGQIQDANGFFVGDSMNFTATGTNALGFVFDGNNTFCITVHNS